MGFSLLHDCLCRQSVSQAFTFQPGPDGGRIYAAFIQIVRDLNNSKKDLAANNLAHRVAYSIEA
jgi:hypothetical protein